MRCAAVVIANLATHVVTAMTAHHPSALEETASKNSKLYAMRLAKIEPRLEAAGAR